MKNKNLNFHRRKENIRGEMEPREIETEFKVLNKKNNDNKMVDW